LLMEIVTARARFCHNTLGYYDEKVPPSLRGASLQFHAEFTQLAVGNVALPAVGNAVS